MRSAGGRKALLAALALVALGCPSGPEPTEEAAPAVEAAAEDVPPLLVDLYFPGGGSLLRAEARELVDPGGLEGRASAIVEAVIAGPQSADLHAPLPPTTRLAGLFRRAERGQLIVDLHGADGAPPPPAGSRRELLTVYSLVNSLALNLEEVDEVVLLWNGVQGRSFSGHVDTAHPLVADPSLIERRSPPEPAGSE